ncbi:hypothetical protein niasHT_013743 [Heterodera trifolii]|uniref:Uncharacterized protein n=1 Tax=Heterodera trifolii TaxID=157864 RepID=A0ABD2LCT7_9BILA
MQCQKILLSCLFLRSSAFCAPIACSRMAKSDVPALSTTNQPYPYKEQTPKGIFEKMGLQKTPDGASIGEFVVMRMDDMINLIGPIDNQIQMHLSAPRYDMMRFGDVFRATLRQVKEPSIDVAPTTPYSEHRKPMAIGMPPQTQMPPAHQQQQPMVGQVPPPAQF